VFTELNGRNAGELNEALGRIGFRRSQSVAYRPSCVDCSACVSVRVLADAFTPNATQRKILRRHSDLEVNACRPWSTEEQYALLRRYLPNATRRRHGRDGRAGLCGHDRADASPHLVIEYREPSLDGGPGKLIGACLSDQQADGLSMIYSFYDVGAGAQRALHLHHPRPYRPRGAGRAFLCLPRLLGRGIGPDGLQGQSPLERPAVMAGAGWMRRRRNW
jgi:arginine-tRNA-protein transferase